jgi:hypothetical protein
MSLYPFNTNVARRASTDLQGTFNTLLSPVRASLGSPVVADVDRLLTATATSDSVVTTVTTFLAQPDVPRSISATPGGTTGDVPAGDITVTGTDIADAVITDVITFAVNASTIQSTAKAFKTVTSIVFPVQDGANATYTVGVSDKLGLPDKLPVNSVVAAYRTGVREGTAPTVTVSSTVLSLNTVDLNSAMDGTAVMVDYLI